MDLEKSATDIDSLGDDHIGSAPYTPLRSDAFEMSDIEKIASIKKDVQNILQTLGLDLTDDSLKGTPNRVAKMFVQEIFGGLHPERKPKASTFDNKVTFLRDKFLHSILNNNFPSRRECFVGSQPMLCL